MDLELKKIYEMMMVADSPIMKKRLEELFCKKFYYHYRIKGEFRQGVFYVTSVYDVRIKSYKELLGDYWNKFKIEGFKNEEDFRILRVSYEDIKEILAGLLELDLFLKEDEREVLANIRKVLEKKMSLFRQVKFSYERFFSLLQKVQACSFEIDDIRKVLNRTSLIHLAYTNGDGLIKNDYSLMKYFRCHFHVENSPSMRVSMTKNFFNCFGCGVKGNQLNYLERKENLTFGEAFTLLANIYMIKIPRVVEVNQELVRKYQEVLVSDDFYDFLSDVYSKASKVSEKDIRVRYNLLEQIARVRRGEVQDLGIKLKEKQYTIDEKQALKIEEDMRRKRKK